uniref:Terminase n=1 Tax=viral metagenome TaxID=1070528 RepID=A0A6M3LHS6_9ZZZZ
MSVKAIIDKPSGYTVGRPSSLTPEVRATICKHVAAGNYYVTACQAAGISSSTFRNWIEQGNAEQEAGKTDGIFFAFLQEVKRAEAERELVIVSRLVDAAMPGVKKKVTKPVMVQGLPVFDDDGNIKTVTETTETGGEWLAAATFLERRHPERWARPAPINQNQGGNTYNINIDKAIIDASEKFKAMIATISERTAAPLALPIIDGGTNETKNGDSITDSNL